jgi:hypothetical protein
MTNYFLRLLQCYCFAKIISLVIMDLCFYSCTNDFETCAQK